jgi:hypothetical protein
LLNKISETESSGPEDDNADADVFVNDSNSATASYVDEEGFFSIEVKRSFDSSIDYVELV